MYFTSLSFTYNAIHSTITTFDVENNVKPASRRHSEIMKKSSWNPALEFLFLKFSFHLDDVVIKCYQ